MSEYKSLYEKYFAELDAQGKIIELSGQANLEILEELNEGMEDFVNQQKVKERHSELELASIVLL